MTLEEQRIAIAEACGYTNVHAFNKWKEGGPSSTKDGDLVGDFGGLTKIHLPNYLGCLNAMHEAEDWLSENHPDKLHAYVNAIGRVANGMPGSPNQVCAKAPQRAEAFLRTLNLWTK